MMLDKSAINEIKAYNTPPTDVGVVMGAVMVCLGKKTDWPSVKLALNDMNFIKKILEYDRDHIPQTIIKKIEAYTKMDNF